MHQPGHYGAALLVYAPVGTVAVAAGATDLAVLGGAGALAGAMLPDVDLRVPGLSHRGPTHTLWFALAVAGVVAAAIAGAGGPVTVAGLGGVVATVTVGSHLLADALTPMGVRPFAPISSREYALDVATADSLVANYALLAGGVAGLGTGFWLGGRLAELLG